MSSEAIKKVKTTRSKKNQKPTDWKKSENMP